MGSPVPFSSVVDAMDDRVAQSALDSLCCPRFKRISFHSALPIAKRAEYGKIESTIKSTGLKRSSPCFDRHPKRSWDLDQVLGGARFVATGDLIVG